MEFLHLLLILLTLFHFSWQYEKLSYRKPTNQSSTFYCERLRLNFSASLAVDDDTRQNLRHKSCSSTVRSTNSWWQVDLLELARVNNVLVYSNMEQGDELGGFQLFLSNETTNGVLCATGPQNITNGQIINLPCENNEVAVRFARIELNGDTEKVLALCEVIVFGQWIDQLLSEGMEAEQSSTYNDTSFVYSASLAVDGDLYLWGQSCSITEESTNPWWQVNLSRLSRVTWMSVYNNLVEGWKLSGFKVFVSNTTQDFIQCASGPEQTVDDEIIHLKCNSVARIVRIKLSGAEKSLTLCEVKVYGQRISN